MPDAAAWLDQLQQLAPPGAAWTRDADATWTRLLAALAAEFARLDARAERLRDEADPRTALELLPDWERLVGLPDACSGAIAVTVPERRQAIVTRLTARGGQSIAYLTGLAAALGYPIAIEEARPSRLGGWRSGQRLAGADWAFHFTVVVLPIGDTAPERWWRTGAARAGDRIRSFGASNLQCVIGRARPAHTTVAFAYPAAADPAFLFDFTAQD